ncbi:MAG TPA: hypothetical protein VLA04_05210 [Verrucomicrobiae bacterium]|nr:hypothetical protein [Verrucomicrobiae bacterium]
MSVWHMAITGGYLALVGVVGYFFGYLVKPVDVEQRSPLYTICSAVIHLVIGCLSCYVLIWVTPNRDGMSLGQLILNFVVLTMLALYFLLYCMGEGKARRLREFEAKKDMADLKKRKTRRK